MAPDLRIACAAAAALLLAGCEWPRPGSSEIQPARAPAPVGPAGPSGARAPSSFAPIIERVSPAVVSIDTLAVGAAAPWMSRAPQGLPGMGQVPVRMGSGSGFLISADGYVVTNNHVVEGAREIVVTLADRRQFPARLVGRDPPTDLAVLKIEGADLPFVSFASAARPQVGDWVVAVGNPFGLGGTATAGIVSAHEREIGEAYVSYLQIDAPINRGNSGGPSFDLEGRVVGVNTAIVSPTGGSVGIGFAIPADLAEDVAQQLIRTGRVTRGYLGVAVQDLTPAIANQLGILGQQGAVIAAVTPGAPAAGALRPGDVVTQVDGVDIVGAGGLTRAIAGAPPGTTLSLRVIRDRRAQQVSVRTARRPDRL